MAGIYSSACSNANNDHEPDLLLTYPVGVQTAISTEQLETTKRTSLLFLLSKTLLDRQGCAAAL